MIICYPKLSEDLTLAVRMSASSQHTTKGGLLVALKTHLRYHSLCWSAVELLLTCLMVLPHTPCASSVN